jgi:hypothetical protein
MSQSGALRHGFKRVWNDPLTFGAELAWRWSFAAALIAVILYATGLFLKSLPVTDRDLFGLSGIIPGLYLQALASIFRGSGPKMVRLVVVVFFGGSVLWLLSSSWARAATVANLRNRRLNVSQISRFNLLHWLLTLLAFVAYAGAFVLAFNMAQTALSRNVGTFYLVLLPMWLLITFVRSTLGWWISLAPFVEESASVWRTLLAAADLARERATQFAWVNFALGGLRMAIFVAAWTLGLSAVLVLAELPSAYAYVALILVVMTYSAIKHWINTWQLAAYVRVSEWDGRNPLHPPMALVQPLLDPAVIPAM